jgi:hypothetical protein
MPSSILASRRTVPDGIEMAEQANTTRPASTMVALAGGVATAIGGGRSAQLAEQGRALNNAPRVVTLQRVAATLGSAAVVQRQKIDELLGDADTGEEIAAALGGLLVNRPGGDEAEQDEFHNALVQAAGFWQRLGANEIGAGNARRGNLCAALMAADAPASLQRLIAYYFDRAAAPSRAARGIGSLALVRNDGGGIGGIEGRPDLFAIATGGASQARRHITAWHTLRNVMNRIISVFDAHDLAGIANRLVEVTDPAIDQQARAIADREAAGGSVAWRIIWLAVVLNNVPHNLWLGAARENISINTFSGHLTRWTDSLRGGAIDLATYRGHIAGYGSTAPMVRRAVALLLAEIDEASAGEDRGSGHLIVNEYVRRTIRPMLEIDPHRGAAINPMQLFLYEFGEGALAIHAIDDVADALVAFVDRGADADHDEESDSDEDDGAPAAMNIGE